MKAFRYLLLSVLTITLLAGCGEEKKKEEEDTKKVKIGVKKEVKKADENVANIVLTGNDLMQFDKNEIRVKAGQKVKLTLRHIGKMDINVMGHNVIILKQGVVPSEFAAKAATEKDNGYIPPGTQDIIAHTNLIGGGQVTTIEFDAPPVGTYDFLCSFPAHFALMQGKFIVE
jgi:azurin